MQPEDYIKLSEPLSIFQSTFDAFCKRHGFKQQKTAIGRYPRIRIVRERECNLYFDLQMDVNDQGKHFEKLTPNTPFSMGAGAWIDLEDKRYGHNITCFEAMPFQSVSMELMDHLNNGFTEIRPWTKQRLLQQGKMHQMG